MKPINSNSWRRIVVFLNLCLCLPVQAQVQNRLRFEHYSTKQGLTQNTITSILQDHQGFLWIGTVDGLNRFDGDHFQQFTKVVGDSTTLGNNVILAIFEDSQQHLMVGTSDALYVFDRINEHFSKYQIGSGGKVLSIAELDGEVWVGASQGLYLFDVNSGTFHRKRIPKNYIGEDQPDTKIAHGELLTAGKNSISVVCPDVERKGIWLGTGANGFLFYNPQSDIFTQHPFGNDALGNIGGEIVFDIKLDKEGRLWVATEKGLVFYSPTECTWQVFDEKSGHLSSNLIYSLYIDSEGVLWAGTGGEGLFRYDVSSNSFIQFKKDVSEISSLSGNDIYGIYETKEGVHWVGTYNGGLDKYDPSSHKFLHFVSLFEEGNSLSSNVLRKIYEEGNFLWVATVDAGLNRVNQKTGEVITFFDGKNGSEKLNINAVTSDLEGNIWAGSAVSGLYKIEITEMVGKERFEITHFEGMLGAKDKLGSNELMDLKTDSKGMVWCATYGGLCRLNPRTEEFENFIPNNKEIDSFPNYLRTLCLDEDSLVWAGTYNGGLLKFDISTQQFITYQSDQGDVNSLSSNIINTLHLDEDGVLWIGTSEGGLNKLNPRTGEFRYYTRRQGLANNYIYGILEDDHQHLWISTNKGISRFNKEDESFVNFDEKDGLQSNEFNIASYFKNKNGIMYFGGVNGYNKFHPDSVSLNKKAPDIAFTGLKILNKEVPIGTGVIDKSIIESPHVYLNYTDYMFSLNLSALYYSNSEECELAYMLEGFDQAWINIGKNRTVTFTNLNPGDYTLKVKSANSDGIWNEAGLSLPITIVPPWWKTTMFKVLLPFFLAFLLFSIIYLRVNLLKKQKINLEKEVMKRNSEILKKNKKITIQNKELQAIQKELQTQSEELQAQQEELKLQNDELIAILGKLKQTQSQLVHSEKMASLGLLTAGIAHEINNPINFIKSGIVGLEPIIQNISMLLEKYRSISKENFDAKMEEIEILNSELKMDKMLDMAKKVTKNIVTGANRTADIVKSLRTFSRIDSEKLEMYDVRQGLEVTLMLIDHLVKDKIQVIKFYELVPEVECTSSKINQVFMNLLVNAAQATEDKSNGEIIITVRKVNKFVEICIKDNGSGMPEEVKYKMFDPFFTTKEVGKGTGLGLSIVKGIIDDHKGEVEVHSLLGEGTEIVVKLPISQNSYS
ncbi:two-component regulator propeller domain-containing protein [Flammeovirgaceae bacterium SG7u.111]|nr:two-component regulator propeller domain-containing protein [Flammeovirgaceae bacterium SG7u.132]WPO37181.1 two-component regulator propeller domain-containing protein [Flammeovirgaceae bacterium SG7u.111]